MVYERYKKLDILVNSARSGQRVQLLEETEQTWEDTLSVSLRAAFFTSQEAIRIMSQKGGSIVNIGSIAAFLSTHESPVYHIAKAGLLQMTRNLAVLAGSYKIRVNSVLPGFIVQDENQPRYRDLDNQVYRKVAEFCHPLGEVGSSDDVARAVLYLCSSEAAFITGQSLIVDGGATLQEQFGLLHRFQQLNDGV